MSRVRVHFFNPGGSYEGPASSSVLAGLMAQYQIKSCHDVALPHPPKDNEHRGAIRYAWKSGDKYQNPQGGYTLIPEHAQIFRNKYQAIPFQRSHDAVLVELRIYAEEVEDA